MNFEIFLIVLGIYFDFLSVFFFIIITIKRNGIVKYQEIGVLKTMETFDEIRSKVKIYHKFLDFIFIKEFA